MRPFVVVSSLIYTLQSSIVEEERMAVEPSSAAGLVSAFTACVDCFEYIRIDRHMGEGYQTALIKLDFLRLRLTRWGEAVGIVQDNEDEAVVQLKAILPVPDQDYRRVTETLGEILRLFERTATTSHKIATNTSTSELSVGEGDEELSTYHALHMKMRDLAIRRQKQSNLLPKTTWALYGRNNFDNLIVNLHSLITDLVDLVPSKTQQDLCKREISEFNSHEEFMRLSDILQDPVDDQENSLDNFMRDVLLDTIGQRGASIATWVKSKAGAGSTIHQGNRITNDYRGRFLGGKATYLVDNSEFGENVRFHQGHCYGF